MVKRMLGPERATACALARETGVSLAALSRWRSAARTVSTMGDSDARPVSKSTRQRSSEDKLQVVAEAALLNDADLGLFLRRKGLHEAQLAEWRRLLVQALEAPAKKRSKHSPESKRIKDLERDLSRKNRALAEVTALLALSKKAEALWGDADGDTSTSSAS